MDGVARSAGRGPWAGEVLTADSLRRIIRLHSRDVETCGPGSNEASSGPLRTLQLFLRVGITALFLGPGASKFVAHRQPVQFFERLALTAPDLLVPMVSVVGIHPLSRDRSVEIGLCSVLDGTPRRGPAVRAVVPVCRTREARTHASVFAGVRGSSRRRRGARSRRPRCSRRRRRSNSTASRRTCRPGRSRSVAGASARRTDSTCSSPASRSLVIQRATPQPHDSSRRIVDNHLRRGDELRPL